MIQFKIDKTYKLKEDFIDITLQDMIDISKLNLEFNNDFAEDYNQSDIINILTILSTAPKDVLAGTDPNHLYVLFDFVKENIFNIYRWELKDIQPVQIIQYKHKGKIYHFPEYLKLGEENILAHKEKSKYVVDANNLLRVFSKEKLSGIEKMKYVCALCMKEDVDEVYDDRVISERAEQFKDLPMYIVLQVFFSSIYFTTKYLKDSLFFSVRVKREKKTRIVHGFIQWLKKGWQVMLNKLKVLLSGNWLKY